MKLENWSVVHNEDRYIPPEYSRCLYGNIFGCLDQDRLPDGTEVTTSPIIQVCGNIVQTIHNLYELGTPEPEFIEFCRRIGCHIPTEEEPIKVKDPP